jgi:hypothetical protein
VGATGKRERERERVIMEVESNFERIFLLFTIQHPCQFENIL